MVVMGCYWLLFGCYLVVIVDECTHARAYVPTEMRMVYFSRRIRWVIATLL